MEFIQPQARKTKNTHTEKSYNIFSENNFFFLYFQMEFSSPKPEKQKIPTLKKFLIFF